MNRRNKVNKNKACRSSAKYGNRRPDRSSRSYARAGMYSIAGLNKGVLAAVLTLVLAGILCIPVLSAYAAGGTVTVNVSQAGMPAGTEFTFNLYKVGDYAHDSEGASVFQLSSDLAGSGISTKLATGSTYDKTAAEEADESGSVWTERWLADANTLAKFINGMDDKPASEGAKTATFGSDGGASLSYSVSQNGLYLLVGDPVEVGDELWTPQPMFISVLDGNKAISYNNQVGVKLISRSLVHEHSVVKTWSGDADVKDDVRPEKIAFKVMYGSTWVDTIVLDESNGYSFSWSDKFHYSSGADAKSTDDDTISSIDYIATVGNDQVSKSFAPENTKSAEEWSVVEMRDADEISSAESITSSSDDLAAAAEGAPYLRYYNTTYSDNTQSGSTSQSLAVSNELTFKIIRLIKNIDGYDDDGSNVTFSFKIVGKDADGNEIYTNYAGVSFTKADGTTKETVIKYIPGDVASIVVTEEYSGNYRQVGTIEPEDITEESTDGSGTVRVTGWEVTVTNEHDDHGPKGGAVNRYDPSESGPKQDPGTAPAQSGGDQNGNE